MKNIYKNATKLSLSLSTALVIFSLVVVIHPVSGQSTGISQKASTSPMLAVISTRNNNTFSIDTTQLIGYIKDKFGDCPEVAIYIHGYLRDPTEA